MNYLKDKSGRQLGYKSKRCLVETPSLAEVMQAGEGVTKGEMARMTSMYLKCHKKSSNARLKTGIFQRRDEKERFFFL